jgi:hypothetical protein
VQPSAITVTLPSPISVTGISMGLSLDLLVSQSETYSTCFNSTGLYSYSITPTFTLTALTFSSSPTNAANGKVTELDGEISALGSTGESLTLSVPDAYGPRLMFVNSGSNTLYQGINNFSALAVGTFVDVDGAVQSDGSVLATRIAVEDPSALNILTGPLLAVGSSTPYLLMLPREYQGSSYSGSVIGSMDLNYGSAAFQTSGQLMNLGSLPFEPSFNASNMVPGQNVYVSAETIPTSGPYPVVRTMTLMPQTINGTVTASSQSGNFTDDTVSLASYDLFPMLAVQPGQNDVLTNPGQVEVYVDSNTQMLNTQPLSVNGTFRFYGLVFNDNGVLRMDCAQVSDGVTAASQPNARGHLETGEGRSVFGEVAAGVRQRVTAVTPSH